MIVINSMNSTNNIRTIADIRNDNHVDGRHTISFEKLGRIIDMFLEETHISSSKATITIGACISIFGSFIYQYCKSSNRYRTNESIVRKLEQHSNQTIQDASDFEIALNNILNERDFNIQTKKLDQKDIHKKDELFQEINRVLQEYKYMLQEKNETIQEINKTIQEQNQLIRKLQQENEEYRKANQIS